MATDSAGNIVLTGYFQGSVDFGGGILQSAGSGRSIFLAKFNPDGNPVWSKKVGGGSHQATDLAIDGAGNVLITGEFNGMIDFGGGPLASASSTAFVAKFDPDGNHVWSTMAAGSSYQNGLAIAADATGQVLVTGMFYSDVDFGGGLLTSVGFGDMFIAKFDPDGNLAWSKAFGSVKNDYGGDVSADSAGNVWLRGWGWPDIDFGGGPLPGGLYPITSVVKFDPDGNHLWSKGFGDTGSRVDVRMAVQASGDVALAGYFNGEVDLGGDPLICADEFDVVAAELRPDGAHHWSRRFGGQGTQYGTHVVADSAGNVLVTGWFEGMLDFGGGPVAGAGGINAFVAKLYPCDACP